MVDAWPDLPYALDDDDLLWAALTAPRGRSYRCPSCGRTLTLQRQPDRPAAFRHPSATPCNGSDVARVAARHVLREQLLDELRERDAIVLHHPCPGRDGGCPDGAVLERRCDLVGWQGVEPVTRVGSAIFDLVVTGRGRALLGVILTEEREGTAPRETHGPSSIALAIEDVLGFAPRQPLDDDHGNLCRRFCRRCRETTGRDRGIGWDEGWRGVLAQVEEEGRRG